MDGPPRVIQAKKNTENRRNRVENISPEMEWKSDRKQKGKKVENISQSTEWKIHLQ